MVFLLIFNILTLCACVKPVDYDTFFEDDNIIDVIYNTKIGKFIPYIEFGLQDLCPQLSLGDNPLEEGGTVTLQKNSTGQIIIVTNNDIYSHIDWYCITDTPLTTGVSEDGAKLTVNTANEPFRNAREYKVTVVGVSKENDDKAYGTSFNIKVDS